VNRHKVYLKQWESGEEGTTPVISPTHVRNYPQFTDIPREGSQDDSRRRHPQQQQHRAVATVDVHVDNNFDASLVDTSDHVNAINA